MTHHQLTVEVLGPWSLATSRTFWEGFAPAALAASQGPPEQGRAEQGRAEQLHTVFRVESDWSRAEVEVTQHGSTARIDVTGDGDLTVAAAQTCRFLSLDVDARGWPDVGRRDPVIALAQQQLPGLRPCGFHSPYEAAVWSVLSQRIRITQAARLRDDLIARHGDDGAFPTPTQLRTLDLDLPGRKVEYLRAVAEAALERRLDGATLRSMEPEQAAALVQQSRVLDRSPQIWSSFAVRTRRTPCPSTSADWRPRSPSTTARSAPWPTSQRPGDRFVPGPLSTCAPSAKSAPTRSAGALRPADRGVSSAQTFMAAGGNRW